MKHSDAGNDEAIPAPYRPASEMLHKTCRPRCKKDRRKLAPRRDATVPIQPRPRYAVCEAARRHG